MNTAEVDYGTSLSSLLRDIYPIPCQYDREVSSLTLDSRQVTAGACFLSIGSNVKETICHMKASSVQGASAILSDKETFYGSIDIPVIVLKDLSRVVGEIADRFFKYPSSNLKVCAVTGTNGKTTVSYLTALAVRFLEGECAYIGTLGAGEVTDLADTLNTTPDVVSMHRLLAGFKTSGISCANIEASSHGIEQGRLRAIKFHSIAFTNLGHDHLDYHGTIEKYNASKKRLFDENNHEHVILNADDVYSIDAREKLKGSETLWVCSSKLAAFPQASSNLIRAKNIEILRSGTVFDLVWNKASARVESSLLGGFNIDNLLMVAATLLSLGYEFDDVAICLGMLHSVPGRMELLGQTNSGGIVYLDYAHTPDSLATILLTVKRFNPSQIFLVFGCGGDRDKSKRAAMGIIAEQYADKVFVTSDNPRYEDQASIFSDIMADVIQRQKFEIEPDREVAIREAILASQENDYVVIAGKGHETTQSENGVEHPFCDRSIASSYLLSRVNS